MSINRVVISGNLTREPELRHTTTNNIPILGIGIAVNERRKNQQTGEWENYPNYVDCTLFGARAEGLLKHLHTGKKVTIEGKLRWSQWVKEGAKRSKIEVVIDEIEFEPGRTNTAASNEQQVESLPAGADELCYDYLPMETLADPLFSQQA